MDGQGYANLKLPTERIPDYANSKLPNPSDKWVSQQLEWFNLVLQLVDFQFNDFKPLVLTFSVDSHFQLVPTTAVKPTAEYVIVVPSFCSFT